MLCVWTAGWGVTSYILSVGESNGSAAGKQLVSCVSHLASHPQRQSLLTEKVRCLLVDFVKMHLFKWTAMQKRWLKLWTTIAKVTAVHIKYTLYSVQKTINLKY